MAAIHTAMQPESRLASHRIKRSRKLISHTCRSARRRGTGRLSSWRRRQAHASEQLHAKRDKLAFHGTTAARLGVPLGYSGVELGVQALFALRTSLRAFLGDCALLRQPSLCRVGRACGSGE